MDLDHIRQILDLVRDHELSEFEIEHDGLRLRIRKDAHGAQATALPAPVSAVIIPPVAAGVALPGAARASAPPAPAPADAPADDVELAVVKSPIVGTFYRCPEPGAPSFVEVGSTVKKGQVLCIIEAMKLMNEIDSEHDGEIVNVYVENGQPVQYGERLFAIRTR
ncbi:MAG: acetyl-CoA carboxylase biotin carboxyl carrier protein [Acidobacteria bacterium]|nr:acetyl-CoA carboxylase biotin carboxyl carrier protein [Acidobacteriota bacterium]